MSLFLYNQNFSYFSEIRLIHVRIVQVLDMVGLPYTVAASVTKWVEHLLRVWFKLKFCWVKSKTEKLAPVASLVSIHHLRPRTGLVGPVSV